MHFKGHHSAGIFELFLKIATFLIFFITKGFRLLKREIIKYWVIYIKSKTGKYAAHAYIHQDSTVSSTWWLSIWCLHWEETVTKHYWIYFYAILPLIYIFYLRYWTLFIHWYYKLYIFFPDFFVQAFKIVVDSWKFNMLLLYILWDDRPIFGWEDTLEEWYAIKLCFELGKNATETYGMLQSAFQRLLTRSHKRTSMEPSRSCWNSTTSALPPEEITSKGN